MTNDAMTAVLLWGTLSVLRSLMMPMRVSRILVRDEEGEGGLEDDGAT